MAAKADPIKNSFVTGLIGWQLEGRSDWTFYDNACKVLDNQVTLAQGSAVRRPGSCFRAPIKDHATRARLLPFKVQASVGYAIELGAGYVRFYRAGSQVQITAPDVQAQIVNGDFSQGQTGWDERSTGGASIGVANERLQLVGAAGGIAWAEQAVTIAAGDVGTEHVIAFQTFGIPGDQLEVQVGSTSTGAELLSPSPLQPGFHTRSVVPTATTIYLQFRNRRAKTVELDNVAIQSNQPVELGSPYTEAMLRKIQKTQSVDVATLTVAERWPRELRRYGERSWSLENPDLLDGPYDRENVDDTFTLTAAANEGLGVALTASRDLFDPLDVGRSVRLQYQDQWGWGRIAEVTDAQNAKLDIRGALNQGTPPEATAKWRLGFFGGNVAGGSSFPAATGLYERRRFFGGVPRDPERYDASVSDDYPNFAPGSEDNDAVTAPLPGDEIQPIIWFMAATVLLIGTESSEQRLGIVTRPEPVTPENAAPRVGEDMGSAVASPVKAGLNVLFIQQHRRKLLELRFDVSEENYISRDLTLREPDIAGDGLIEMAFQQDPNDILWACTAEGRLLGLTYKVKEQVEAWHTHPMENGAVESVCTVPGVGQDELWMIVRRTIGGETRRYVEVLTRFPTKRTPQADMIYLDSSVTHQGEPITVMTGLDHLEGELVGIFANGAAEVPQVVKNGQVTLQSAAYTVHVGLLYGSEIVPVPPELGDKATTTRGKVTRPVGLVFGLHRSYGVKWGQEFDPDDELDQLITRDVDDPTDTAPPLVSGAFSVPFAGDYDREPFVRLVQNTPYPMNVTFMAPAWTVSLET